MNESEKVLELYISQQQEKINELSQQILMLTTRNKYLEQQLSETSKKLKVFEEINKKKLNKVEGFKHVKQVKR